MNNIDQTVEHWLPIFLEPFTHISYGVIALTCLFALALLSIIVLSRAGSKVQRQIRDARRIVEGCENEVDFTSNFGAISAGISALPVFAHSWVEFEETLIPPLQEVDDPAYRVYRNTTRPQDYFNAKTTLSDVKPFIESDRLIGIGLILTFLGLVAALSKASGVFIDQDKEAITEGLAQLLSTAGAKFLASIGGLGGAITQSVFQSLIHRRTEAELAKFNDALEKRLSYASQERIAADHYGHAQRQTARLEEMGTEITLALGNQLRESLEKLPGMMGQQFTTALQPMQDHLESVTKQLAEGSEKSVADMVAQFSEQIQGASDTSMQNVTQQLETLSSTLASTVGEMRQSNAEMRTSLSESLDALKTTSAIFKDAVGSSADAASTQLKELIEQLKAQQESTANSMAVMVDQFKQSTEEVNEKLKDSSTAGMAQIAAGIQEALRGVLAETKASSAELAKNISGLVSDTTNTTVKEVSATITDATQRIADAMQPVTDGLADWSRESQAVSGALSQTNLELGRHQTGLTQSGKSIADAGVAFSTAASTLRSATDPLAQTLSKLASAAEAIQQATVNIKATTTDLGVQLTATSESTETSLKSLEDLWVAHSAHFTGVDKSLESAFQVITENLETSLSTIREFNNDFSDKVGRALTDLGSIVSDLSDTTEDLAKRLK